MGGSCAAVSWVGAPTAASGTVAVSGDGSVSTGPSVVHAAGCYSWADTLSGPSYVSDAVSAVGQVSETTLVQPRTPTVSTTVSAVTARIGESVTDRLTVSGSSGSASTVTWSLLGPVDPTGSSCPGVGDPTWVGAPVLDTGTVATAGDGTIDAGTQVALPDVGCYTFIDSFAATAGDTAVTTAAGIAGETVMVTTWAPQLSTTVSTASLTAGDSVHDTVSIAESGGYQASIGSTLLGPVAPQPSGSCAGLDWSGAPTVATTSVAVAGDGSYHTGDQTLGTPGCYTYVMTLPGSDAVDEVSTQPGEPTETVLVTAAAAPSNGGGASLADTGVAAQRQLQWGGLLLVGLALLVAARRRRRS